MLHCRERSAALIVALLLAWASLLPQTCADVLLENAQDYNTDKYGKKPFQTFASRPDLHTPIVNMRRLQPEADPMPDDPFFLVIHGNNVNPWLGSLVLNPTDGSPLWISHHWKQMFNLQVQNFQGEPHLTFWDGGYEGGFGRGWGYIMNQEYQVVKSVRTALGQVLGDLHEFQLTTRSSALISYQTEKRMMHQGVPIWVRDGCFQEVDIATGSLILEWCSSKEVPVSETQVPITFGIPGDTLDYFHLNSVDRDPKTGNYLVSGRHCHTLYILSPQGKILSRIGGKSSDYKFVGDSVFTWQHDARWTKKLGWDGTSISLFDNAWDRNAPPTRERSRGLIIGLDDKQMIVSSLGSYESPVKATSGSQGSMQVLANEDVVVGYGLLPHVAQYKPDGTMSLHIQFGFKAESYRTTRQHWVGRPQYPPVMNIRNDSADPNLVKVFTSWNGATRVASWRILAADKPDIDVEAQVLAHYSRAGFETGRAIRSPLTYFQAQALAMDGTVLGSTKFQHRDTNKPYFAQNPDALEAGLFPPRRRIGSLTGMVASWFSSISFWLPPSEQPST